MNHICQGDAISIGDMVLVHDADRPRGFWKIARVEDLISGSDGQVRGAYIRTSNRPSHLRRPIQLLYPLQVHSLADANDRDTSDSGVVDNLSALETGQGATSNGSEATQNNMPPPPQSEPNSPPKRIAARNAREFMRIQAED